MSPSSKSVFYFGFYLYATGLTLLLIPNIFLRTLQLPETKEVWIRVVGVLALCVGYYYHRSGAGNFRQTYILTVHARIFVCIVFGALVLAKLAPPVLAGFGFIDLLGAVWTWTALKRD